MFPDDITRESDRNLYTDCSEIVQFVAAKRLNNPLPVFFNKNIKKIITARGHT